MKNPSNLEYGMNMARASGATAADLAALERCYLMATAVGKLDLGPGVRASAAVNFSSRCTAAETREITWEAATRLIRIGLNSTLGTHRDLILAKLLELRRERNNTNRILRGKY